MSVTKGEIIQLVEEQIQFEDSEVYKAFERIDYVVERSIYACQRYVNNSNYDVMVEAPYEVIALSLYLYDAIVSKASVEKGIASISQSSRSVSFLNPKELEAMTKEYIQNSLSLPRFAKVW